MASFRAVFFKRKTPNIVACSLLVLIGTLLTAFGLARSPHAPPLVSNETPVESYTNAQPNRERVEVELVTVRRDGMEPTEITRPAGGFVLAVDNRSGLSDLALRLEGGPGQARVTGRIPFKKLLWRTPLELPPGTYTLRETNHSDWVCRITITAR